MNVQRPASSVLEPERPLRIDPGPPAHPRREMSVRTVIPFLALTFGLSWGIGVLLVLFGEQIESIFGELGPTNPVYLLLVYSPAIAAVFLVCRHYGTAGLGSYLRRLWRMPRAWWAFLLVGVPAMVYASAAVAGRVTDFPFSPWHGPAYRSAALAQGAAAWVSRDHVGDELGAAVRTALGCPYEVCPEEMALPRPPRAGSAAPPTRTGGSSR
ncbi:hypothetical protein BH20ACT3_BH20ACT3_00070 [soil metagenome]